MDRKKTGTGPDQDRKRPETPSWSLILKMKDRKKTGPNGPVSCSTKKIPLKQAQERNTRTETDKDMAKCSKMFRK